MKTMRLHGPVESDTQQDDRYFSRSVLTMDGGSVQSLPTSGNTNSQANQLEEMTMTDAFEPSPKPDYTKLAALRVPFPANKISKKPRGGTMLDYVGHADITERMLEVDPEWNWSPCQWEDGAPKFVKTKEGKPVGLWIRLTVCGVTRLGYGSVEATAVDAEKQLIGDALRNAAMRFGVALELWSKSEAASASAPPPVRAQRIETQLRPQPKPQPQPQPKQQSDDEGFLDRVVAAFESEDTSVPFDSATGEVMGSADSDLPTEIQGVPLTVKYDPQWAYGQVLPFGKHKGMTLRALASDVQGGGYIRWLSNKIVDQFGQGKTPNDVDQAALIVNHHLAGGGM
jgi:hypothetical protein